MIRSRNIDPEAGRWSDPIKLASSTTASFAFRNPTGKDILIDKVVIHVTTAAAGKTIYAGVSTGATATNATNSLMNGATLTSGQSVVSDTMTTVVKGSYVVGTLNATDSTLVAYAYIYYKELPL